MFPRVTPAADAHAAPASGQHKSSHFHLDPSVPWNIWGHLGVHCYLLGAVGYLVIDNISDFTQSLSEADAWTVQIWEGIVLALIFFLDAIFYYKASCFAPWKTQPGVPFHVLSVEVRVALAKVIPCFRTPPNEETVVDTTLLQRGHSSPLSAECSLSIASTTRSDNENSTCSTSSSADSTPVVSRSNSIVATSAVAPQPSVAAAEEGEVLKPDEVIVDISGPALFPTSLTTVTAPPAPIEDLGYLFPLCLSTCGESLNTLASFLCLLGALLPLYPWILSDAGVMETGRYYSLERAADLISMVVWTASSLFYHRDWQTHYSQSAWCFTSLDGLASATNVLASSLYLYASIAAIVIGETQPSEWRYLWLGVTPNDVSSDDASSASVGAVSPSNSTDANASSSADLSSIHLHPLTASLWSQLLYCSLLADCLYVFSALLYELSNIRHHYRAKALRLRRQRVEKEERGWKRLELAASPAVVQETDESNEITAVPAISSSSDPASSSSAPRPRAGSLSSTSLYSVEEVPQLHTRTNDQSPVDTKTSVSSTAVEEESSCVVALSVV